MTAALAALLLTDPGLAAAQAATSSDGVVERAHAGYSPLGTERDWTAIGFGAPRGDKPGACAIYARPKTARVLEDGQSVPVLRGEIAAYLTWEDGDVTRAGGVASFLIGATVAPVASHTLTIDGKSVFPLYGSGDRLYPFAEDDTRLVEVMRGGREMVLRADLTNGRSVEDAYSLMGVQAATRRAERACN